MESCIGKTYEQIWQIFIKKHGETHETKRIHNKWKKLAAEVK